MQYKFNLTRIQLHKINIKKTATTISKSRTFKYFLTLYEINPHKIVYNCN